MAANEPIFYTIRRSRRAKNILLRIDTEGAIEVVLPWGVAWAVAEKFVSDKQYWLKNHLRRRRLLPSRSLVTGSNIPYLGDNIILDVVCSPHRRRAVALWRKPKLTLHVQSKDSIKRVVEVWYRRQARLFFSRTAQEYASILGVNIAGLAIGNQRTQWGSCSGRGRLSFNWRLLLGPEFVARYVAAHEVAHLVYHNHSPAYWAKVREIYPAEAVARAWLRDKAGSLHW